MSKAPQYTEETPQRENGQVQKWVDDPNDDEEETDSGDKAETDNPLSEDKQSSAAAVKTFDMEAAGEA